MSWHMSVRDVSCAPGTSAPPAQSPFTLPALAKMRGELTTRASCGAASGTRITSMRKYEVFGSFSGSAGEQPASSFPDRGVLVPETYT